MGAPLLIGGKPNPMQKSMPTDLSKALIERENAEKIKVENEKIAAYQKRMDKVLLDVTKILEDNNVNLQEWSSIVQIYNKRFNAYSDKLLISVINQREYAKPSTPAGETANGSGESSPSQGQ